MLFLSIFLWFLNQNPQNFEAEEHPTMSCMKHLKGVTYPHFFLGTGDATELPP